MKASPQEWRIDDVTTICTHFLPKFEGNPMLILHCPNCGQDVDETDLHGGGEAHLKRFGPRSSDADFEKYLFMRENPKGVHFERWHHTYGCGKWFLAARCTATLEVFGTYPAQTTKPPQHILDAITAKRPGWSWGDLS